MMVTTHEGRHRHAAGTTPDAPPPAKLAADTSTSTAPSGVLRASSGQASFGPIPVTAVVGLEMLAAGGVLLWAQPGAWLQTLAISLLVLGLLLLPTGTGEPVGTWLARRTNSARRRTATSTPSAMFSIRVGNDARDHTFGVIERSTTVSVVLRVTDPDRSAAHDRLSIGPVLRRLRDSSVPIQAVSILRETPGAQRRRRLRAQDPVGNRDNVAQNGAPATRHTDLVLTLVHEDIEPAVLIRGGGQQGVDACLSVCAALATSALRAGGFRTRVLDPRGLRAELTALLGTDVPGDADLRQTWRHLSSGELVHRMLSVTSQHRAADVDSLCLDPGADITLVTQIRRPCATAPLVRTLVRVSGVDVTSVTRTSQEIVETARARSIRLKASDGAHLWAALETSVLSSALSSTVHSRARFVRDAGSAWIRPGEGLERLGPYLRFAVEPGDAVEPADHDVDSNLSLPALDPRSLHWVVFGGVPAAAALADRIAGLGLRVLIRTEDPDRWTPELSSGEDGITVTSPLSPERDGDGPVVVALDATGGLDLDRVEVSEPWVTVIDVCRDLDDVPQTLVTEDTVFFLPPGTAPHPQQGIKKLGLEPDDAVKLARSSATSMAMVRGGHLSLTAAHVKPVVRL